VNVYITPNPNNGVFTVGLGSLPDEKVDLTIYNTVGTQIYHIPGLQISANPETTISLQDVPKGLYFIQVKGDTSNYTRKVVIR
jgi:hypothetical protein